MEVGDWRHDQSKCPLSRPVTGALGGGRVRQWLPLPTTKTEAQLFTWASPATAVGGVGCTLAQVPVIQCLDLLGSSRGKAWARDSDTFGCIPAPAPGCAARHK